MMEKTSRSLQRVAGVVVVLEGVGVASSVAGWWYVGALPNPALADFLLRGFTAFIAGVFGAGALLFASWLGLKGYETLPGRIFTAGNIALFLLLGGGTAVLLWTATPSTLTPIYSAGVGSAWPAVLQGLMTASQAKDIAQEQVRAAIAKLSGPT